MVFATGETAPVAKKSHLAVISARLASSVLLFASALLSQNAEPGTATGKTADIRSTPRGSLFGFLQACREGEYRRAASFLDTHGGRRGADPAEQARLFKEVLDRKLTTALGHLSDTPEGDLTDGLDPKFELIGTVPLGSRRIDLLLERVLRDEGSLVWLIASGTVSMIPVLYEDLEGSWIESRLPSWLLAPAPVDSRLWQWLALLLLAGPGYLLALLLAAVLLRALRPLVRRAATEVDDTLLASIASPARLLIAVAVVRAEMPWIAPSVLLRTFLARLLITITYLALAWLAMRIIDVVAAKAAATMTGRQRASASSILPLLRRTVKVAAVILAILATLGSWGYNTTALLAGLGVGGLAIALAAQKTIENLFGGVALTTDRPVLIGDFCRYGDRFGIVEDIGLRSTRIRTLDRTLVTVPNAQFASLELENFGRRDKIWFHPAIRLRLDTTTDQVRRLVTGFRDILLSHPKIGPTGARVRFIGITPSSLDIEVFAYVATTDFDEYLVVQENLLLAFMEAVEAAGARLAAPAQWNVLGRDRLRARQETA